MMSTRNMVSGVSKDIIRLLKSILVLLSKLAKLYLRIILLLVNTRGLTLGMISTGFVTPGSIQLTAASIQ